LKRLTLFAAVILALVAIGALTLLSNRSAYTLTSYKKQGEIETITLRHEGHSIQAECSSYCDEFGTMVGRHLFCFTEPAPSDPEHPYGTKRPIFNALGGSFVCRTDGGTGTLFMVRRYKCLQQATASDYEKKDSGAYPEDSQYSFAELDKLYCKAGEVLSDDGGDIVTENGKVLPLIRGKRHTEVLKIAAAR
jgi:hypothetical protein